MSTGQIQGINNTLHKNSYSDISARKQNILKQSDEDKIQNHVSGSVRKSLSDDAVDTLGELVDPGIYELKNTLRFQIHEPTGQLMAIIKNSETGEIVRTLPPEELLEILTSVKNAVDEIIGTFVNEVV